MKKILFPVLAIVLAVGLALPMATPVAADDNLVVNGSFEEPIVTNDKLWDIFDSGTTGLGWTVEWYGGAATYNSQARPEPAYLELHRGVNGWLPSDGEQYAELDTDWDGPGGGLTNEPASVRIYQDLDTVSGGFYELSFVFSPRPDETDNQLEVKWDGTVVDTLSASGNGQTQWTPYTYPVTASTATTRLEFTDLITPNSYGTFLDDVSVTPKPGSITIIKDVVGEEPDSEWEFTGDLNFNLPAIGGTNTSDNLTPGVYTITETTKPGYTPSVNCSNCDNCTTTDNSVTIDLGPGHDVTCTFTNTKQLCSISGYKYRCDVSDNCTDVGLEGWIINLDGPVSDNTTTDSNGYYKFENLPDGTYTVTEVLKPGWEACTRTSYPITLCKGQQVVASDNNTMVTQWNVPGETASYPAEFAWEHPDWTATKSTFSCGADWIWESYRPVDPVNGNVVEFQRTFYIPGNPTGGTLYITCDNGYEVYVNGGLAGSAQVYDTVSPPQDWETSDLTKTYVNTDGWQSVEPYDVSTLLQSGTNTLVIKAANEYMGALDGQNDGDIESNPAGLIYELSYDSDVNFCNRELGSITIVKEVIGDAPESDWEFTSDNITDFSIEAPGGSHTSDNLTPGVYTITETAKTGYAPSVNCTDCDNYITDGDSVTIDLGPGDNVTCTFTNTRLCEITGHKYRCDTSGNCTQTGLGGWTINLTGPVSGTTTTDNITGYYELTGLFDGTYTISETLQDDWVNCTPASYEITIDEDCQIHSTGMVVSDTHTQVTDGNGATPHNAVYAWEAWDDPPDTQKSYWDKGLDYDFSTYGADWIWESYRVVHPVAGDIVEFERTFYIPGTPTDNCTLYITCDNGYEVYLNGTFIDSAQLVAGWETSNLTQGFVDTTNWQSVEDYDVSTLLQNGNNTLVIKTANEYMGPDDDPTQDNGTINSNPAGLIFELSYEFTTSEINFCNREGIPNITILKTADPTAIMSGEQVTYTYRVTNTGDVDLTNITVADDQLGNITNLVDNGDGDDTLSPGETWVYQATANPTDDVTNTATATGTPPTEEPVSDTDTATVEILEPEGLISGHKYMCDVSDNCTDEGLEGWTINLSGPVSDNTTTDSNGYYEFTGLPDGTYTVSETPQDGWKVCGPTSYQVTLTNGHGESTIVSDATNEYWDWGADVTWGTGDDQWVPAVPCYVHPNWPLSPSGATWLWRTDEVDPVTEYNTLPPEGYRTFRKIFEIPSFASITSASIEINADNAYKVYINGGSPVGHDGNLSKDGPTEEGWKNVETFNCASKLVTGTNTVEVRAVNYDSTGDYTSNPAGLIYKLSYEFDATQVNFCNRGALSISGMKFNDLNGSGANESEPGLDGWTINLEQPAGTVIKTATTTGGGFYSFDNLTPGTYIINEVLQAGWAQTYPAATGTHTVVLVDSDSEDNDFGNWELEPGLTIDKQSTPATGNSPGDTLHYVITYGNTGNAATDNVTITDNPDETYIATISGISGGGAYNGDEITWNIGTLDPGASGSVSYDATLHGAGSFPTGTTTVDNIAVVSGTYPVNNQVSDNTTASVTISSGGGGNIGGVGGYTPTSACPLTLTVNVQGTETMVSMTLDGVLCEDCMALGPQGQIIWAADAGTKLTLANNKVPRLIKLGLASSPPPPSNAAVVGPMYELNAYPSLYSSISYPITISPLCSLVLPYDPDELPDNTSATLIAYYDEELGKWVDLETAGYVAGGVEVPNSLTSQVNHFTTFAVLAKLAEVAPAKFSTSNLTINPTQAQLNQEVIISVTVTNSGGTAGDYNVRLTIDDVITAAKQITLATETSQTVSFTINADAAGKHQVEVAGLTGEFEILGQSSTGFNWWWLIGGVLILVLLSVLWLSLMRRRLSS